MSRVALIFLLLLSACAQEEYATRSRERETPAPGTATFGIHGQVLGGVSYSH